MLKGRVKCSPLGKGEIFTMKKTKLMALLLAASMTLTACGNDGGTKKIGVFAGIKTANKAVGTLSASPAKMRVKELAKLVNDMDYEEIDMDEIPEEVISKYSFIDSIEHPELYDKFVDLEFYTAVECGDASKHIVYYDDQYCMDYDEDRYYRVSSPDENTYKRLAQLALRLNGIDYLDYEKKIKEGGSTDVITADKVKNDTGNPNYTEWIKGICSDIASVPDRGEVTLLNNDYTGFECAYRVDNLTEGDFEYLVDKYKKEGFNQDIVEYDHGFMAFSENAAMDYVAIGVGKDSIVITVGGDRNRAGSVTAGWDASTMSQYAPKPESGECYLSLDKPGIYPVSSDSAKFRCVVYNIDTTKVKEYVELCESKGFSAEGAYNVIDDKRVDWTGCSSDGMISITKAEDDTFMIVEFVKSE